MTWRNLKEDYVDKKLIAYSWLAVLAFLVGGRISYGLINWGIWNDSFWSWWAFWQKGGFDYYGAMVSMGLTTWWYCMKNDWKVWTFFEDMALALYIFMAVLMLSDFIKSISEIKYLVYFAVAVIGVIIIKLVSKKYRSFVWYRSGKKGFVFLFVNIIVAILLLGVGLLFRNGWFNVILNVVICLSFLVQLLNLGDMFKK